MAKNIRKLFVPMVLFCLGLLISCGGSGDEQSLQNAKNENPDSSEFEKIEQVLKEENRAQIHVIEKKAVIFFIISKKEMQDIMHEIGDSYRWDSEALFTNFIKQASTFKSLLKKHNIECDISTSQKFEVKLKNNKVVSFDRIEKDQILGEIISDGIQQPLIEFGMYTNSELAKLIEKFYGIPNLGYIPPTDTLKTETPEQEAMP